MKIGPIEITYGKGPKFEELVPDYLIEITALLHQFNNQGVKINMALNPEVKAFADAVKAKLDKIAADIQRLLDKPSSGLSDEDRAELQSVLAQASTVDDIVPE